MRQIHQVGNLTRTVDGQGLRAVVTTQHKQAFHLAGPQPPFKVVSVPAVAQLAPTVRAAAREFRVKPDALLLGQPH